MTHRLAIVLLPAILGLGGCRADRAIERDAYMELAGDIVVGAPTIQIEAGSAADRLLLGRPTDIATAGARLYISDALSDRVVMVDSMLEPVASFGTTGSGPGELRSPVAVRAVGGAIAVGEITGMRISVFDAQGGFMRAIPMPAAPLSFAVRADGNMLVPARSVHHHLNVIAANGAVTPFAARVHAMDTTLVARGFGLDLVALSAGDTVHVFDNDRGRLLKFAPDGRFLISHRLPESILQPLQQRREAFRRGLAESGYTSVSVPIARSLTVTDDGELVLRLRVADVAGLLIDPSSYQARVLRYPSEDSSWWILDQAGAIAIRDDVLFAIGANGIARYPLRTGPSS